MAARKRKVKIPVLILASLAILGFVVIVYKMMTVETTLSFTLEYTLPEFPAITLPSFPTVETAAAVNGKVIGSTSSAKKSIASTAKIITALVVMEEKPFNLGEQGENITISQADYDRYTWYISHNGSTTKVEVQEVISEYDALVAMLIASSNNMADTLATWAFSSLDQYREAANSKLVEWGITDTEIGSDASGYSEDTISTASDMAILSEKVLENPVLAQIVNLRSYTIPVAGEIENTNKILGEKGIAGIKTGYNGKNSGYCLMSGYTQDGNLISTALLGASTRQASFDDTLALTDYLQSHLQDTTLVNEGKILGKYEAWWISPQNVLAKEDVKVLGWQEDTNNYNLSPDQFQVTINGKTYDIETVVPDFPKQPNLWQRLLHVFGWSAS